MTQDSLLTAFRNGRQDRKQCGLLWREQLYRSPISRRIAWWLSWLVAYPFSVSRLSPRFRSAAALLLILLALPAFAADAAPASPWASLFSSILTPAGIVTALGVLSVALGLLGANAALWRKRLALAAYHAFHVVEDIDSDPGALGKLSKVEAGLKAANDYFAANGWRPLKPGEVEVAKLQFSAMNGAAEAAAVTQAKAQVLAVELAAAKAPPVGAQSPK